MTSFSNLAVLIRERQACGAGSLVTFLNPFSYTVARRNLSLFAQFDCIKCDGFLLVALLRMAGMQVRRESFDMTSMAPLVLSQAELNRASIYMIGGQQHEIDAAEAILAQEYPGIHFLGKRNGYFANERHRNSAILEILQLSPDIVLCGMGTPIQERFLADCRAAGWVGTGFTCGAFLSQTTERLHYYPKLVDRLNLRAVYRFIKEPSTRNRYIFHYPPAVLLVCFDLIRSALAGPTR